MQADNYYEEMEGICCMQRVTWLAERQWRCTCKVNTPWCHEYGSAGTLLRKGVHFGPCKSKLYSYSAYDWVWERGYAFMKRNNSFAITTSSSVAILAPPHQGSWTVATCTLVWGMSYEQQKSGCTLKLYAQGDISLQTERHVCTQMVVIIKRNMCQHSLVESTLIIDTRFHHAVLWHASNQGLINPLKAGRGHVQHNQWNAKAVTYTVIFLMFLDLPTCWSLTDDGCRR